MKTTGSDTAGSDTAGSDTAGSGTTGSGTTATRERVARPVPDAQGSKPESRVWRPRAPRKEPGPVMEVRTARFNEYAMLRFGTIAAVVTAVLLLAAGLLIQSGVKVLDRRGARSAAESELLEELAALRGAWDPTEKARILDRAAGNRDRFAGPLNRVLRLPGHQMLEVGVEYAGALGAPELRPTLVELANTNAALAPSAIRAAERLEPWSHEEIVHFLREGAAPVQRAALEIASRRRDAPWAQVVELLFASDDSVREAAIAAIPRQLPPELSRELWTMVDEGTPNVVLVGVRALSRTALTPEIEERLANALRRLGSEAQLVALDYFAGKEGRLKVADQVWALVCDEAFDPSVRIRALYALEQTASYDAMLVQKQLVLLSPELQYFAARCLVAEQPGQAGNILLDLLHGAEQASDDTLKAQCRRLLAWLTGASPTSRPEAFRAALQQRSAGVGRKAPAYEFTP